VRPRTHLAAGEGIAWLNACARPDQRHMPLRRWRQHPRAV